MGIDMGLNTVLKWRVLVKLVLRMESPTSHMKQIFPKAKRHTLKGFH